MSVEQPAAPTAVTVRIRERETLLDEGRALGYEQRRRRDQERRFVAAWLAEDEPPARRRAPRTGKGAR